ncbi:MAG: hypothetical protein SCARUB_03085 [Candidatus Scalindua rubra]|uniref:TIR domain-containing protein n=1 Tax=Candidatus Scalindua rubra TaxID=1872076 RepID=A0A1E3X8A2_9BACT|nr:MAG: hypothetical protein SCARUB_03085 [Candidatus Scalindua rubra]
MSDIFISYDSFDLERTKILAEVLQQQGWSVWWDRKIPPGKSFDEVITKALNVAKCVVVLWSRHSVKSDWVKEEASEGAQRKILVPALIDYVSIPLGFRRIHVAQLVDGKGQMPHPEVNELIGAITTILGHPRVEKKKPITTEKTDVELLEQDERPEIPKRKLRSQPIEDLTEDEVKIMLKDKGFFDSELNKTAKGFSNNYELQHDGKVVFDRASGLMWQQSGSYKDMAYKKAKSYIMALNRQSFTGYSDWRLPTLEEAISLMEPTEKVDGLYIDPVFDKEQQWIWTSDQDNASSAWVVIFFDGGCLDQGVIACVRAVR